MRTPQTVMSFTHHSWWHTAKQLQRLQADVTLLCGALGVPQAAQCELLLLDGILKIKASASLATKLRHIEPELKTQLNDKAWNITAIELGVVRNASELKKHLTGTQWVNPNIARYGKRTLPSEAQRAFMLARMKQSKFSAVKR